MTKGTSSPQKQQLDSEIEGLLQSKPTKQDAQLSILQEKLTNERDARREDWFIGIVILVLLLNIMLFSVMPTSGGPIAILILQLLILVPLARRMGMQHIVTMIDRVLGRISGVAGDT